MYISGSWQGCNSLSVHQYQWSTSDTVYGTVDVIAEAKLLVTVIPTGQSG